MLQSQRIWRTVAIATVAATALAACSSSKSSSSSSSASSASGGAKCTNVSIGFFGSLTGPNSPNLGINENNGVKLAIAQFNAANPNCQVKAVEYDSQGDPAQAPALATKAAGDSSVVGIVGPAFSGESKAADPTFNDAGLPTITASATNPTLSQNSWKIFHRAVGNDDAQGPAIASYITNDVKSTKVAVINDESAYGQGLAGIVKNKLGSAVVAQDTINSKGTDFSSTVTKVQSSGATAVFYGGYYQAAGVLAKQLKDAGVNAAFVSDDGTEDQGFVTAAGNTAATGAVATAPAAPISTVPNGAAFVTAYQSAYNSAPGLYSAEAYDAANIFLQAITAGDTTRSAIENYLTTVDYKGLTKTYKFDSNGELAGSVTVYAYQVKTDASCPSASAPCFVGLKAVSG
ncbi:MAG: branched-chain amino acid ABC transporter substrate-binding protein [Acidimicrobiales bacterium]